MRELALPQQSSLGASPALLLSEGGPEADKIKEAAIYKLAKLLARLQYVGGPVSKRVVLTLAFHLVPLPAAETQRRSSPCWRR